MCEPFSRDIRGAAPNNLDTFVSAVMARQVVRMVQVREPPYCAQP